jgi:transcriptional regulator with XRE-family HTH domain
MNSEITERLITIRKALGLKQGVFAQTLGIPQTTLSTIEHGKSPLQERYIKLICLTFGVSEQWLRTGDGEIFDEASPLEGKLLEVFRKLPNDLQDMILEYAELLSKHLNLYSQSSEKESAEPPATP